MEYTRDLGYCAAQYLLEGGDAAMVSMQGGQFEPVPFRDMLDPTTGRARVRMVDIESSRYKIARRYMIRLRRRDFEDAGELAQVSRVPRTSTPSSSARSSRTSSRTSPRRYTCGVEAVRTLTGTSTLTGT